MYMHKKGARARGDSTPRVKDTRREGKAEEKGENGTRDEEETWKRTDRAKG